MYFPGMDFEKEGKGVREDGKREKGAVLFLGIVRRKFWAMMRINLLQAACSLPAMALSVLFLSRMVMELRPDNIAEDLSLRIFFGFVMISLQLTVVGPLQAGFIYIMRNYAREENVFIWHHFVKGIKENWKRSLAVSLIDLAVVFLMLLAYRFYGHMSGQLGPAAAAAQVAVVVLTAVYAMMHLYIYPMMVTLDLTVKQLYANALRFAFGKLLTNLGILLLMLAISVLMFINILVGVAAMMIIGYSFLNLLSTCYAYGGIEKNIIQKITAQNAPKGEKKAEI